MEDDQPWFRMPPGYRVRCEPCPGGYYWHLYCRGTRVNGGLSADDWEVQRAAQWFASVHSFGAVPVKA